MVFSPFQLFLRWTLVSTASDMPLHLLEFVFLPGRYFLIIEKISRVCRKFATAGKNVSRGFVVPFEYTVMGAKKDFSRCARNDTIIDLSSRTK